MGDFDAAEKDYAKAIQLDPNNAEIHNDYAWHLIDSGRDVDKGVRLAERALELLPGSASIMDTLGWGYFKRGECGKAVYRLKEASRREPQNREFADHLKQAEEALRAQSN
jgi:Tfp pilus assembly protein PilF